MPRVPSSRPSEADAMRAVSVLSAQARQRVTQDPHNTSILTSKLHKELIRLTRQPYRKARLDILFLSHHAFGLSNSSYTSQARALIGERTFLKAINTLIPNADVIFAISKLQKAVPTLSLLKLRAMLKHCLQIGVTGSAIDLAESRCEVLAHEKNMRQRLVSAGLDDTLPEIEDPDNYICPITYCRMIDPVYASDGKVYERSAIMKCLTNPESNHLSPLTRQPLTRELIPAHELRADINAFYKKALEEEVDKMTQNVL